MFCDPVTEACRFRKCATCCEKVVSILEFEGLEECYHDSWESVTKIDKDGKHYIVL